MAEDSDATPARRPPWLRFALQAIAAGLFGSLLVVLLTAAFGGVPVVHGVLSRVFEGGLDEAPPPSGLVALGFAVLIAAWFTPWLRLVVDTPDRRPAHTEWIFAASLIGALAGTVLGSTTQGVGSAGSVVGIVALRYVAFRVDGEPREPSALRPLVAGLIVVVTLAALVVVVRDADRAPVQQSRAATYETLRARDLVPGTLGGRSGLLRVPLENTGVRTARLTGAEILDVDGGRFERVVAPVDGPGDRRAFARFEGLTLAPGEADVLFLLVRADGCPSFGDAELRLRDADGSTSDLRLLGVVETGC